MAAIYVSNVLPSLQRWREAGQKTALVTLIGVDGSAPRPLGSQMAVNARGEAVGNITGGCAEAAIIAEAQALIASGTNRCVRYGAGSPYIDIQLPCGSGIDVYFDVGFHDADLGKLMAAGAARRPAWLLIDQATDRSWAADTAPAAFPPYARLYEPTLRIVAAGKGPIVPILARLAAAADFEVIVMSSEPETLDAAAADASVCRHLTTPEAFDFAAFDPWTAFVSLFHEHDWEPPILARVLGSDCFYLGALGSRRTHEQRLAILRELGWAATALQRIRAPVGLKLGGKSPPEIAVAILAEIIATKRSGAGLQG